MLSETGRRCYTYRQSSRASGLGHKALLEIATSIPEIPLYALALRFYFAVLQILRDNFVPKKREIPPARVYYTPGGSSLPAEGQRRGPQTSGQPAGLRLAGQAAVRIDETTNDDTERHRERAFIATTTYSVR